MLTLEESDYLPIDQFELLWRFTNPKHVQVSADELTQLRVLSPSACKLLHSHIVKLIHNDDAENTPFFQGKSTIQCDVSGEPDIGRQWLNSVVPKTDRPIFVSWDEKTALETNRSLFIKYWDGFCYPSSDDTSIVPNDFSWIIQYWHEEKLFFSMLLRSS